MDIKMHKHTETFGQVNILTDIWTGVQSINRHKDVKTY